MSVNILLIIVILLLAVPAFVGYRKGALMMLFAVCATVLMLGVTWFASPYVSTAVERQTPVYRMVKSKTETYLEQKISAKLKETTDSAASDGAALLNSVGAQDPSKVISLLPLPSSVKKSMLQDNTQTMYDLLGVSSFCEYIAAYVARLAVKIVSMILTLVLAVVVMFLLRLFIKAVSHLPVIHATNKLLGGCLGLVEGMFFVWLLFLLITALSGTALGQTLQGMVDESQFLTYISDSNLFLKAVLAMVSAV